MPTVVGTTRYGDINQRTAAWAATEMLAHAEPVLVLSKMGMTKPMPKNKAEAVKWRRPIPFAPATEPVVEGVTPSPQKVLYEDVTVTLKQYGRPIEITDRVADLAEDPVLQTASMLAGEQAASTIEQVLYGVLRGGTNVFYANGASRSAVNTPITVAKQRAVTRALAAQKAAKITRMLASGTGYGVSAIEAAYIAVGHTDLEHDIRQLAPFVPTAKYGTRQTVSDYEIGAVDSVRYVLSPDVGSFPSAGGLKAGSGTTMISTDGTNADVYPILYFGQDAFASVPLKGSEAITPMVVNAKPTPSDPMAQRNYVSWKTYFAAAILNDLWMARLEVSATLL
jgi:N4-gp56 family major capsid protein